MKENLQKGETAGEFLLCSNHNLPLRLLRGTAAHSVPDFYELSNSQKVS